MAMAAMLWVVAGVAYMAVAAVAPVVRKPKVNPYAAHAGAAVAIEAGPRRTPTEFALGLLPQRLVDAYRSKVEVGADFRWGGYLDRQLAFGLVGIGVGLLVFGAPALAVLVGIAVAALPYALQRRKAKAYKAQFLLQLPNALRLIGSAMAAGRNFVNALEVTTPNLADPIRSELSDLHQRIQALRITEVEAFRMWADRLGYADLQTAASALAIGDRVGLETYVLLRNLAGTMQAEIRARNELEAVTSQVRSTASVIMFLPAGFVLLMFFIAPNFVAPLFTTPVGWVVLVIAIGMNLLSRWFASRILARIEL